MILVACNTILNIEMFAQVGVGKGGEICFMKVTHNKLTNLIRAQ